MLTVAPIPSKGASEALKSHGKLDETSKKGLCWSELKRTGMSQWGTSRLVHFQPNSDITQMSSSVIKDEDQNDGGENVAAESLVIPEIRKRKCNSLCQLRGTIGTRSSKSRQQNSRPCKQTQKKNENAKDRWSAERFKQAEQFLFEILKDEGAVFGNAISRSVLRNTARKSIGDTGLLDHLLKHIDGKVAPGATERFRRCYNTEGSMEYWLESADLLKIKLEAGVPDPNYVAPSSWWKPGGGSFQDTISAGELQFLKTEMDKIKGDVQWLVSKQREKHQANPIEEMHKELMKWKAKTDQRLMEISSSLSGMQDMYKDLVRWKAKIEQQLSEFSNSLSNLQASKQCATLSPSDPERWEDWLDGTNLDDIHGEDFVALLENSELANVGQEAVVQDPFPPPLSKPGDSPLQDFVCAREVELLKEEITKMKRYVQELVPRKQEEDQANVTPESSLTINSTDLDTSVLGFSQDMWKELLKWKGKMEEQLMEISKTVSAMKESKL
ncbi:hypothetical protein LWI29_004339 [Acer saccharum]|uniref:PTC1-like winged helix-turn-helix domain-containing protein n=1 Tax=Acer saccharum TaxID=4024 RepID=A0AA39T493_ACESA|nr:hypothetical protein LWI29_004339 [Acer saccharum]KAK1587086.1 hypothetical protein Q3G72_009363 [Acer saccharum]